MAKQTTPYIDFYESNKIIPVHQDTKDLQTHFQRRNALYYQMGLIPGWMAGKSVIEFGPGTGDNAMHTSSLSLSRYVLVDGNSESIKEINNRIDKKMIYADSVAVSHCLANEFDTNEKFDLVICEGLVPGQLDSSGFLRKLSKFCKVGGIIVTTTVGATSCLGDTCRHALKPFFALQTKDFWKQVDLLVQFFKEDIKMLHGMSRFPKDWVLDTVMHDWGERPWFSIEDAITALKDNFIFHGSSPCFFQDFRWYKSIQEVDFGFNNLAIKQSNELIPLLLDYRNTPENCQALEVLDGIELENLCEKAYAISYKIHVTEDIELFEDFLDVIKLIIKLIERLMPQTADSLSDYYHSVSLLKTGQRELMETNLGKFRGLFGRGQQYICMVKVK